MKRLDAASPIPEPGWAFRIHTLHTSDTAAPYLTGTWHHSGAQPADPACALWLVLAPLADGEVEIAVLADHEQIPGAFAPIARFTGLQPGTWTQILAPVIAAHPYVICEHTPAPAQPCHRAARAILAYLITHH